MNIYTYVFLIYLFFEKIFGGICEWKRKENESGWLGVVLKKIVKSEKFQRSIESILLVIEFNVNKKKNCYSC